jgi:hypothetical protein
MAHYSLRLRAAVDVILLQTILGQLDHLGVSLFGAAPLTVEMVLGLLSENTVRAVALLATCAENLFDLRVVPERGVSQWAYFPTSPLPSFDAFRGRLP